MAEATVKTVQYLDPRIEPQPDPVYDYVIAPTQNQYYKINASSLSNSSITFNNLTTLGIDRAYLDTMELELTATIVFNHTTDNVDDVLTPDAVTIEAGGGGHSEYKYLPIVEPDSWTFDSFPFNKCCDQARVNINGGAFFSQPMSYIRAKERYMNQRKLSECYENICPCHRAELQYESGRNYGWDAGLQPNEKVETTVFGEYLSESNAPRVRNSPFGVGSLTCGRDSTAIERYNANMTNYYGGVGVPTRYGAGMFNWMQSTQGIIGGFNNSIIKLGNPVYDTVTTVNNVVKNICCGYENYFVGTWDEAQKKYIPRVNGRKTIVHVTWREPIFCSPFSSRYDATYGRPLYNITSMDLNFIMQDLGNMIRICNYGGGKIIKKDFADDFSISKQGGVRNYAHNVYVENYSVNIDAARLCYQVMTIPPILNKPLTTLVPYRNFVPYITDYHEKTINSAGMKNVTLTSGVYTLNEIPTAIWLFVAPDKTRLQTNKPDVCPIAGANPERTVGNCMLRGNYDSNKQFAFINKVNISLANTTMILATADKPDLYRIAKANGCEDSYWSWGGNNDVLWPCPSFEGRIDEISSTVQDRYLYLTKVPVNKMFPGAGSVLRLIPGVDLVIPDQALIPGANGNNMVFQASVDVDIPANSGNQLTYSLWLLFEYVGVAAISPGQCEITMNPLGSGEIMTVSPVMSATSESTEGDLEGSGHWDRANKAARIAGQLADEGIISMILSKIPGAKGATSWLKKHGLGEPATKRCRGGAVIGKGLNDWV